MQTTVRKSRLFIGAALLSVLLCSAPFATADDFSDGSKLYAQRNFKAAAAAFERAMQHGNTAQCAYYCALCHQMSGNQQRANQLYQYLAKNFAGTQWALAAARSMQHSGGAGAGAGGEEAVSAGEGSERPTASSAGSSRPQPASNQNFSSRDTTGLIKVVKPLDGRDPCSQSYLDDATNQLKNIPLPLMHLLRGKGLKVCLTPTAVDNDPDLLHEHPRGYENGKSFRDVPAYYDPSKRTLVVAEYAFYPGSDTVLRPTDDPLGSMWHEMGHAVDDCMGDLSGNSDFVSRYKKDVEIMDDGERSELSYFTQPGEQGRQETFAELFASIYGGRNNSYRLHKAALIQKNFGDVESYIKFKISQLR